LYTKLEDDSLFEVNSKLANGVPAR
jgi:hypothetical protein